MKYKSRKSGLFAALTFGVGGLVLWVFWADYSKNGIELAGLWLHVLDFLCAGLLFWIYFGTNYTLNNKWLTYKSGFFKGKISIEKITEVECNKTLWVGLKPATATKGLIIKYNKYDEIYISPLTNESFCEELLKRNASIKITHS